MDFPVQLVTSNASNTARLPYVGLFGSFVLRCADGSQVEISNSRARAVLALLCLEPGTPIERDFLADLLWHGRFKSQARASLRQCLFELGKALEAHGSDILISSRHAIAINPAAIRTDLGELEEALASGAHTGATRLIEAIGLAPLLERMDFGEAFASFLDRRRVTVEARLNAAVGRMLSALEKLPDRQAYARLNEAWQRREAGHAGMPNKPDVSAATSLAVLPFRTLGSQESHNYFSDGIVEELITTLSRVPELQVAGRSSSFHFRASDLPLPDIAATLRVSHVVEGSVQSVGENVRIHVHLIDGATGFELWGQRYDGTLGAIFALQETVARAVSQAVGEALGMAIQQPVVGLPTQSKAAYDLYLQGRSLCARRFGDRVLGNAVSMFEQALAIDPHFAECWAALAEAHQLVSVYTQCLDRNAEAARMAECARRAIELKPTLGYPYSLLGLYELTRFNFTGALDYAYQGYALEPNDPAVAMRLGCFLLFIGRTRDAAPYIQAAVDQDPVDGRKYALLWGVHFCQGDYELSRIAAQRMLDLGMTSISLGVSYAALGQHDVAMEVYQANPQVLNDMIEPPIGIGVQTPEAMAAYWAMAAKGMCGGREEYRETYWQVLEMLYAVVHDKSDPAISGPAIFTGNTDLAYRSIGQRITPANLMALVPLWTRYHPICRIWQHPQFLSFARQIGMVEAWEKYGWPDLMPRPDDLSDTN